MAKPESAKHRNIQQRIANILNRNGMNDRYVNLSKQDFKYSMEDAFHAELAYQLGQKQDFLLYWEEDENGDDLLKVKVYRNYIIFDQEPDYDFDISFLGEERLVKILNHFQMFLDDRESKKAYEYNKSLRNGLVRGRVIKYNTKSDPDHNPELFRYIPYDHAVIEFFTIEGVRLIGHCSFQNLPKDKRSFQALKSMGEIPFEVIDIQYSRELRRLDILLSFRSKKLPELIIEEGLQDNDYSIENYRYKCLYRDFGHYTELVIINRLPVEVFQHLEDSLKGEILRLYIINDPVLIHKLDLGTISYEELKTVQKATTKASRAERMKKLKEKAGITASDERKHQHDIKQEVPKENSLMSKLFK